MDLAAYKARERLSLTALAARLGRPPSTVHGWLSGARRPDWASLEAIVAATGGAVTADDFLVRRPAFASPEANEFLPTTDRGPRSSRALGMAEAQAPYLPVGEGFLSRPLSGMRETQLPAPAVNPALREAAQALGVDVEAVCERAVRDAISAEKGRRWLQENQASLDAWNEWIDKNGIPLAKHRAY